MYVQITFPQRRSVMGKILLDPRITGAKINKNIYGHFSEHLGRCVYQLSLIHI